MAPLGRAPPSPLTAVCTPNSRGHPWAHTAPHTCVTHGHIPAPAMTGEGCTESPPRAVGVGSGSTGGHWEHVLGGWLCPIPELGSPGEAGGGSQCPRAWEEHLLIHPVGPILPLPKCPRHSPTPQAAGGVLLQLGCVTLSCVLGDGAGSGGGGEALGASGGRGMKAFGRSEVGGQPQRGRQLWAPLHLGNRIRSA